MKIAITDANIFIDIYKIGGLGWFSMLELEVHTTNWIINELTADQRVAVESIVMTTHDVSIESIQRLELPSGLSEADKSIICCAELFIADDYAVLSNDNQLRKWCQTHQIKIHGVLWIFDNLVEKGLMLPSEAHDYLHNLMKINQWLPKSACEERLNRWSPN
jgi:predicted nucleic acid-binding protein